jgi:hypothetical protein
MMRTNTEAEVSRRGADGGFGESNRTYGDDNHDGLDPNRGFNDSGGPLAISIPQKHRRQSEHLMGKLTMHTQRSNRLT